jgi:hypothetical protein
MFRKRINTSVVIILTGPYVSLVVILVATVRIEPKFSLKIKNI